MRRVTIVVCYMNSCRLACLHVYVCVCRERESWTYDGYFDRQICLHPLPTCGGCPRALCQSSRIHRHSISGLVGRAGGWRILVTLLAAVEGVGRRDSAKALGHDAQTDLCISRMGFISIRVITDIRRPDGGPPPSPRFPHFPGRVEERFLEGATMKTGRMPRERSSGP